MASLVMIDTMRGWIRNIGYDSVVRCFALLCPIQCAMSASQMRRN
jgi:hypothetical protein